MATNKKTRTVSLRPTKGTDEDLVRVQIAVAIHDGLAQTLASVTFALQLGIHLVDVDPARAKDTLSLAERHLRKALLQMRLILADLQKPARSTPDRAVIDASELGTDLDVATGVTIEYAGDASVIVGSTVGKALVDIGREVIRNALLHAGAGHVRVFLRQSKNRIILSVSDNGRGFDPAEVEHSGKGFGLTLVRTITEHLGGRISIETRIGAGTKVLVELPCDDNR